MKNKNANAWRTTAIVFMVLFTLSAAYICWGVWLYTHEVEQTNICYYDICSEYPDAYYEEGVCSCYDYDMLGEPIVVKTEYMDG